MTLEMTRVKSFAYSEDIDDLNSFEDFSNFIKKLSVAND